jgi:hypothetical protein
MGALRTIAGISAGLCMLCNTCSLNNIAKLHSLLRTHSFFIGTFIV